MLDALGTAKTGLLQAERRATDIAKEILQETSNSASFTDALQNEQTSAVISDVQASASQAPQASYGNLIQQFADLRAEEQAFKANATAFKRIDETLGTLLDDEG